jgi:hypothetical protein
MANTTWSSSPTAPRAHTGCLPATQPQPFTAESITAVIEPLRAKFPQLRHFVVDGASVNTAAISGMNMFSELATSIEVEVKE